ncbi:hypothetical protein [Lacticaseibacillus parakribbianus]|uniref:hypothetical protein n=1 Tax=Lacticaseibacillus parakribbianus TaxID=2970927 RepID=UPI0021CB5181|nr:hypothetical protein [Lacticaseibacillus parakribbianus]
MRRFLKLLLTSVALVMVAAAVAFFLVDRKIVADDVSASGAQSAERAAQTTYRQNVAAINAGDQAAYLATVPPAKRAATEAKLGTSLSQGTRVTLQSFKVQKVTATGVVAKVSLKQVTKHPAKTQVLENTVEFVRQGGRWYIQKSVLVNVIPAS